MEYASEVWNPYQEKYCNRIERVQKKFIKFALFSWNFSDIVPPYESRCKLIHLDTLVNRRSKRLILLVYKLLSGQIDCPYLFIYLFV